MSHRVVALAYDRLCTFEFGCTVELFALPRPELSVPWYEFAVCALERGPLRATGGIEVRVRLPLRLLDSADTIVIPGWRDPAEAPPPPLVAMLQQAFARGARLCSICSGVFVLAAAGVLDGRRATTHWRYVAQLAARYPRIRVEPNALYVDEGRLLTSAGSAAGLDMLLHLVRCDFGAKIANQVAQRLVAAPHALASLAARAAMSTRTLQREFTASTGLAPHQWLLAERVERAKELLETTRLTAQGIATRVGLGSAESLRHHFRRRVGTTPGQYRRRFSQRT